MKNSCLKCCIKSCNNIDSINDDICVECKSGYCSKHATFPHHRCTIILREETYSSSCEILGSLRCQNTAVCACALCKRVYCSDHMNKDVHQCRYLTGIRILNYDNGEVYKGNLNFRDERDGYGIQYLTNGGSYKGYWKNDEYLGDKAQNPIVQKFFKYNDIFQDDEPGKNAKHKNIFLVSVLVAVVVGVGGLGCLYFHRKKFTNSTK